MNNLSSFFRTKGIAFVWIGAVFAPILLMMGIAEDKIIQLIIGVGLLLLVLVSIIDGFKALRYRLESKLKLPIRKTVKASL
jgi:hypothetical protein